MSSFKALRLKVLPDSCVCHWMYVKEHNTRVRHESKPQKRTLMVVAVPPFLNVDSVQRLFSRFGTVENVFLQKAPSATAAEDVPTPKEELSDVGYRVAYVVFKAEASLKAALNHSEEEPVVLDELPPSGVAKWAALYRIDIPNVQELQTSIKATMEKFDEKKKQEKDERKSKRGIPDAEGWITVTREDKRKPFRRSAGLTEKLLQKDKEKKKESTDFYNFQIRESKLKKIEELRKKFEEDKKRLQMMRAARKFRPY